jgi:hypothetical protein
MAGIRDEDYEQSTSMIEQRIFSAMLEYLLDVLILTVCFSTTKMKFNYLSRQHERVIQSIHSKRDLREKTQCAATEVAELLETLKGRSDLANAFFDQVFERSLVKLVALGYVREERVAAGDRTRYEYAITQKGLDFYLQETRPIFGGFLRHLRTIDITAAEAKGLEKYG